MAAMWRQCGSSVAAMWWRCGGDVAAMSGGDVAAMWHRCHVVVTSSSCRRRVVAMTASLRRHVVVISSPCNRHVVAMSPQCSRHVGANPCQACHRPSCTSQAYRIYLIYIYIYMYIHKYTYICHDIPYHIPMITKSSYLHIFVLIIGLAQTYRKPSIFLLNVGFSVNAFLNQSIDYQFW